MGERVEGSRGERIERSEEVATVSRGGGGGDGFLERLVRLRGVEWWFNRVGIGLLLFGVALVFKLSVDVGWVTPPIRVGIGLAIGFGLLFVGLRVYEERRSFSQVSLGGGIGAFYITGFASFGMYSLVSWTVAFAFMGVVTLLAFVLALRQSAVTLSLIGTVGGLATPFVLQMEDGSAGALVLHACLILAGAAAVYLYKGWQPLLVAASVGAWVVFEIGAAYLSSPLESSAERWLLQAGVAFGWLAPWLASVLRKAFRGAEEPSRLGSVTNILSMASPLVALDVTQGIWSLDRQGFGLVTLAVATAYLLVALGTWRRVADRETPRVQAATALLFGTLSLPLLLGGDALFCALVAEAAALHLYASRTADRISAFTAHAFFAVSGLWFAFRILSGADGTYGERVFDPAGASMQLTAVSLAFVTSFLLPRQAALVYRISAHVAFLVWCWSTLWPLSGGGAYTTIAWGLYGAGLVVAGLRWDCSLSLRAGLATLCLVVGKLFFVDLFWVEPLWRALLFLGFGGLFLLLGYYLQSLWKPDRDAG